MSKKRVLIFPAGTEIAFEIQNALKYSKFVELIGGTSSDDHSAFTFSRLITGFPYVDRDGFLEYLNKVILEYNIDCVYPAHDSVCVFLSEHADEISAQVIVTEPKTVNICRSKRATYDYFLNEDFIPRTFSAVEDVRSFPVFVKPAVGQGAKGTYKIEDRDKLNGEIFNDKTLVVCEYLPGTEYTADCFTDKNGTLLTVKLRTRERIRSGISVRSSVIETDSEVARIAERINSKLHFKGAWFFQLKKDDADKYKLMEISPRIPGTMGLSRNLGINFTLLTLFVFWGYEVSIIDNGYKIVVDRAFYSAYRISIKYDHIYLDYDDTLIIDGKVNRMLLAFLYQAVSEGKKVHLLSKHIGDLNANMSKYRIAAELFDEVIVLSREDEKYKYIGESSAIFIDDSFVERKTVKEHCKIPVFDVDMIEGLIDWRM